MSNQTARIDTTGPPPVGETLAETELEAIARVIPPRFQAATLVDRVTLLVVQHQHDDERCRVWEREAQTARAEQTEKIATFVEHLRDEYWSICEPVSKVARLIREKFAGGEAEP